MIKKELILIKYKTKWEILKDKDKDKDNEIYPWER